MAVIAVAGVLLIAAVLRSPITSVGPVLQRIGSDVGLSGAALGLLGALPPLAFAAVSPFPHLFARRLGIDRTVLLALLLLIIGIVLRSLPVPGLLWVGSLLLGGAIAVGNVLVPAVVKRDFAGAIAPMTGAYSTTMNTFAAIASGLTVPLAAGLATGWRGAIGAWALLAGVTATVWMLRSRLLGAPIAPPPDVVPEVREQTAVALHRSALAWQVTLYMGVQSTLFYTLLNWLPAIETSHGFSATVAGSHLFGFQAAGIVAALVATVLLGRRRSQRRVAVLITIPMIIGLIGMLTLPALMAVWAVLAGLTTGSSIVVALSLIGLRSRGTAETARMSGMAQSFGYLLAACGPVIAGALSGWTGAWWPVIAMLLGVTLLQAVLGLFAGRDRYV